MFCFPSIENKRIEMNMSVCARERGLIDMRHCYHSSSFLDYGQGLKDGI